MRNLIVIFSTLLFSTQALSDNTHTQEARQSLKNYGLGHCILKQFDEKTAIEEDISLSVSAYSFMGKGMHTVLQNEETLETLHDPYKETREYIYNAYTKTSARSKHSDKKIVFYACLKVFNSVQFDDFITTQDKYISE
ncbi:hypothetical protein PS898_03662 [Pseudomonas fluorescens]|nr:hypothetical protein PS898_03662 [Pseudomonas fluorescens]